MDKGFYIRLDNGDIFVLHDTIDNKVYISPDYGFDIKRVKYACKHLIGVLDVGDLVRMDYYSTENKRRITGLFHLDWISEDRLHFDLSNGDMFLNLRNSDLTDEIYKPIITGVIPREKLPQIEQSFSNDSDMKLVL